MKADKEGKRSVMWCNLNRQLSPGFSINRMTHIAERCDHYQRNGPLTFLPDSHIQWSELAIPSLLGFPDIESGMKIHLPLSWPLVGGGCYLASQVGRLSHPA